MKKILILHGVNLNMFGLREAEHYGRMTLAEIDLEISRLGDELGLEVETFQTNHEGEMVARIHRAFEEKVAAVVINPGAWTHYSYALLDSLSILNCPVVEVHMSHVEAREEFRSRSVIAPATAGRISGFGHQSYLLGLRAALALIEA